MRKHMLCIWVNDVTFIFLSGSITFFENTLKKKFVWTIKTHLDIFVGLKIKIWGF